MTNSSYKIIAVTNNIPIAITMQCNNPHYTQLIVTRLSVSSVHKEMLNLDLM